MKVEFTPDIFVLKKCTSAELDKVTRKTKTIDTEDRSLLMIRLGSIHGLQLSDCNTKKCCPFSFMVTKFPIVITDLIVYNHTIIEQRRETENEGNKNTY